LGKPLPARFENPEPVHRFTGKIFLKPGNYPVSVNRATALISTGRRHHLLYYSGKMEEILPVFWFGFVNLATPDVVRVCLSCAFW
jgi:hypothetical protein